MGASHSSGNSDTVRSWTVTTRAARRVGGTTKFEPWTTSTRADEPLEGRNRRPCAQAAWSGRAGMGRWPRATPAGTRAAMPSAAAPAHREGGHVEIVAGGQAAESTRAERADPGGPSEQGGRVESDGQPVGGGGRWSLRRHAVSLAHPTVAPVTRRIGRRLPGRGARRSMPRAVRVACADDHRARPGPDRPVITALAGGVGAARLLRGMVEVVPPGTSRPSSTSATTPTSTASTSRPTWTR